MFSHLSDSCDCEMNFSVYLPPKAEADRVPVLYWLSGLTCTHENFITKAGAERHASELALMLVVPDTSPRGVAIKGEDEDYDLGTGAGFYINATREKWAGHYRMEDYVISELPLLIEDNFPVMQDRQGIFGHSMGGHGALTLALKNPGRFRSVSAFSPICAPSQCVWGEKAFSAYLGDDREEWLRHDANELMKTTGMKTPILIDQGAADDFLESELNFELFRETCARKYYPATLRLQEGYDHSYYFIATFIEDHLRFHAEHLKA